MQDFIRSSLGGEAGDAEVIVASSQPVWHLVPLPLSQIRPSTHRSTTIRGPVPSLRSSCLSVVSGNLHTYTHESFEGVPKALIQRILSRVSTDRGYEADFAGSCAPGLEGVQEGKTLFKPDEATIWALSALLDPEGTEGDFTLALPIPSILQHLRPNTLLEHPEHPLNELPKLYRSLHSSATSSPISLLSTLTLDGMDMVVNDQNVQALKWCTNLTALWMKGCRITDTGVRLLASSLELPGEDIGSAEKGRGMWRLRAWSVNGCRSVGDRAMQSFARWPGLVQLDVRNTSCTSAAIEIFNRTSQNIFSGYNAPFQSCTDGLLRLFAQNCPPSETLDALRLTLLTDPSPAQLASGSILVSNRLDGRDHIALHIVPSHRPMMPNWLPNPPALSDSKHKRSPWTAGQDAIAVYRSNGIGQIYGASVGRIVDEAQDFRARYNKAQELSNEETQLIREEEAYELMSTTERRKFTTQKNKRLREEQEWRYKGKAPPVIGKIYKEPKRSKKADEDSKAFVQGKGTGNGSQSRAADDDTQGDRVFMLVRIVHQEWYKLKWATSSASASTSTNVVSNSSGIQSTQETMWIKPITKRVKSGNLVEELLGSTQRSTPSSQPPCSAEPSSSAQPSLSQQVKREPEFGSSPTPSATPKSSRTNPFSSSPSTSYALGPASTTQTPRNPFRSQNAKVNSLGVRPLSATPQIPKSGVNASMNQKSPFTKPFASSSSPSVSAGSARPKASQSLNSQGRGDQDGDADDGLSFSSTGNRRNSGGSSASTSAGAGDPKRRGMKMFSVGSGRV